MRRLSLGLAIAATLASAGTARADVFTSCGMVSGFTQCASATVTQVNATTITVTVTNLSSGADSYRLTAFGFYYTGATRGTTTLTGAVPAGWTNGIASDLENPGPGGTPNWILAAEATPPTAVNSIDTGESGTFTFSIAPGATLDQAGLTFAFRAQSIGPAGELSNKIYTSSTVPEPATVLLLAGGMLGLGGVGIARRRKGAAV